MLTRSRTESQGNSIAAMAPSLDDVMSELKLLKKLMNESAEKAATKEDVIDLKATIEQQNLTIKSLGDKVQSLQSEVETLKLDLDDKEQYQRRTSLRIFGLPQEEGEDSESCRAKIIKIIQDEKLDITLDSVDRAHRIGKREKGKPAQVILKFATFRSRTIFYRARDRIKTNHKVRTHLDLTKSRLDTLNKAKNLSESSSKVKFICANINCELMAVTDGKPFYFRTLDDLDIFLGA